MFKNGWFRFRSAVYTSGRFPHSLLSLFSFCWMCHLSSMHCAAVWVAVEHLGCMPWPTLIACSASAEAATSPFLRAHRCSLYIGQTGRSFKLQQKEPRCALRKGDMATSAFRVLVLGRQHVQNPAKEIQEAKPAKGPFEKASSTLKYSLIHFKVRSRRTEPHKGYIIS